MKNVRGILNRIVWPIACAFLLLGLACTENSRPTTPVSLGDQPGIATHLSNEDIATGSLTLQELIAVGEQIFSASFNTLDGAGNSKIRKFLEQTGQSKLLGDFNRISGPDANACSGCHNLPVPGGGGDNVANVFVLAHQFPNVAFDNGPGDLYEPLTLTTVGNERGTISMFGSGLIELLAREMTQDLQTIKESASNMATLTSLPVTVPLVTKEVSFGKLTVWPDGLIDATGVSGIDEDLIVKPFSQKGVYTSLREFTLDALDLHHGLQAQERVGKNIDGDEDGVSDELTTADTTALTLFQASLPSPVITIPESSLARNYIQRGERIFSEIGCVECHKPYLELNDPIFTEPNPYNPPGTLQLNSIPDKYNLNLLERSDSSVVQRTPQGTYLIYAYTDLKRHDMGPILANETVDQRYVEPQTWITKKLWGMMSEPPFLHHGRATLLEQAITAHGGEAEESKLQFNALLEDDQIAVIEFLKTFQMPAATSD